MSVSYIAMLVAFFQSYRIKATGMMRCIVYKLMKVVVYNSFISAISNKQ